MCRVLVPGGWLVLTAPLVAGDVHKYYCLRGLIETQDYWDPAAPKHKDPLQPGGCPVYRIYSVSHLKTDLRAAGFDAIEWTDPEIERYAITDGIVFLARRPT